MGSHVTGRALIHIKRCAAGGIPGFLGRRVAGPGHRASRAGESVAPTLAPGSLRQATAPHAGLGPLGGGGGMKVTSLDGRQLRKMLRKEAEARCVVLDCRPYLAFAASSVRGSLNVNLNSVVLRRARGGAVSARYVLPDEAARARLLQEGGGGVAAVVVLDQGSRHWQKLREESAARVVLTSLLACLPAGPRVYFLKGELAREPRAPCHPPRSPGTLRRGHRGPQAPLAARRREKVATRGSVHPGVSRAPGRSLQASASGASCSPPRRLSSKASGNLSVLRAGWAGKVLRAVFLSSSGGRGLVLGPGAACRLRGSESFLTRSGAIEQVETLPRASGAAVSPFFPPRQLPCVRLCLGGPLAFLTRASPSPSSRFIAFYCFPAASFSHPWPFSSLKLNLELTAFPSLSRSLPQQGIVPGTDCLS